MQNGGEALPSIRPVGLGQMLITLELHCIFDQILRTKTF